MEEWEKHRNLSGGSCFEMYFNKFDSTICFKVVGLDGSGTRKAINCETGEHFDFNVYQLSKKEYVTIIEIDCKNCNSKNDD